MKLLLDTHIWLWSLVAPDQLTPRVRSELESATNELWLSPVSTWELLVLIEQGRMSVEGSPDRWVAEALKALPAREALLTHEVARWSWRIDLPQGDPADRFLAASARVYDLALVTADERLLNSREYAVLANR